MTIYLFDTDIASAFFDKGDKDHGKAFAFVENAAKSGDHIYVSCIAIAEIRYGLALYTNLDKIRSNELDKSLNAYPRMRNIEKATSTYYAEIRSQIMRDHCPTQNQRYKKVRPESLVDKTTAKSLGIQENDLWLASIAVQHKMTLVSEDKMAYIKQACPTLNWVNWR